MSDLGAIFGTAEPEQLAAVVELLEPTQTGLIHEAGCPAALVSCCLDCIEDACTCQVLSVRLAPGLN